MNAHVPGRTLLSTAFGDNQLVVLRRTVAALAADAGLDEGRRQDLVLAVDELVTNVVVHGGGTGRLDLWVAGSSMWFRVSDSGPGMAAIPPNRPPSTTDISGRGLWIARQIIDELDITTGPGGTTVVGRVRMPVVATREDGGGTTGMTMPSIGY